MSVMINLLMLTMIYNINVNVSNDKSFNAHYDILSNIDV